MLNKQYYVEKAKVDRLVARKNTKADFYNGIYDRYDFIGLFIDPEDTGKLLRLILYGLDSVNYSRIIRDRLAAGL